MVSERNRVLELVKYFEDIGLDINIAKTKARGNNGVFIRRGDKYRIDISKNIPENRLLGTILHEFAHYIHYKSDKSLNSLDFIFDEFNDELKEELIQITVKEIPKDFAQSLFKAKDETKREITNLSNTIKKSYPNFKITSPPLFMRPDIQIKFFILKQKQNVLKRVNYRINKLNKYYNNNSELFARFMSLYFTDKESARSLAPKSCEKFEQVIKQNKCPELSTVANILTNA